MKIPSILKSLRFRLVVPVLIVGLALLIVAANYTRGRVFASFDKQIHERARMMANSAAEAAANLENPMSVNRFFSLLGATSDLEFVGLIDTPSLTIRSCNQRQLNGKPLTELQDVNALHLVQRVARSTREELIEAPDNILHHYALPVRTPEADGSLRSSPSIVLIRLNDTHIDREIRKTARFVVFVLWTVISAILAIVLIVVDLVILRPTAQLTSVIEQRSAGTSTARVMKPSNDEIGRMGAGLNHMLDALGIEHERVNESRRQFQSLVNNIPGVVYRCALDEDWTMLYMSPNILELAGYPSNEFVGNRVRSFASVIHPDDTDVVSQAVDLGVQKRQAWVMEYRIRHRDGSVRWIYEKGQAIRNDRDEVLYLDGFLLDVTSRKHAETILQESRETAVRALAQLDAYKLAIDEHLIVAVTDTKGVITYANRHFEQISGYSRDELIGKTHRIINSGMHDSFFFEDLWKTILAGKVWRGEICNRAKKGSLYWVKTTIAPLFDDAGEISYFLSMREEITEEVQRREQLALYANEIEVKNIALNDALASAQEANRLKSDFLATMSHEIRTPMNGVIGMTGLLLDTDLSEEQLEYANTVRVSAESLLTIINDILDFSKIEAGKLTLEPTPFNLRDVLEDVADILAPKAHDKLIELTTFFPATCPDVLIGDQGRIRQILMNFASNAVKFTQSGSVVLSVEALGVDGENLRFRLQVKDTGIGIEQEVLGRLFQKFVQANSSTTRMFGGTGLGLAISKQLTELMGGSVSAVSEKGVGSTFTITLSLPIVMDAGGGLSPPVPEFADVRIALATESALLKDGIAEDLQLMGTGIGLCGAPLVMVSQLTSLPKESLPHVVLIDPGLGLTLRQTIINRLVETCAGLNIPIIHLRTEPDRRDEGDTLSIQRPVRLKSLGRALEKVFGTSQGEQRRYSSTRRVRELLSGATRYSTSRDQAADEQGSTEPRVLLVEDNAVNQHLAVRILERMGCHVEVANNGKEGIEMAGKGGFDIILMDCQMPVMDGFEATNTIRSSFPPEKQVPIIAMTANAMQGDREACLEAGMDDYLSKPINVGTFQEKVSLWLAPHKAASLKF